MNNNYNYNYAEGFTTLSKKKNTTALDSPSENPTQVFEYPPEGSSKESKEVEVIQGAFKEPTEVVSIKEATTSLHTIYKNKALTLTPSPRAKKDVTTHAEKKRVVANIKREN